MAVTEVAGLAWHTELGPAQQRAVRDLLDAVAAVDGRPDLPAQGLPGQLRSGRHLLAGPADEPVGYAHLDPVGDARGRQVGELFVRPDARGRGLGTRLTAALLDQAPRGADTLRLWAHGDHPAAARVAARLNLRRVRELRRMWLTLPGPEPAGSGPPEPRWPAGVRLRGFVPGLDEPAVVAVNRRAFSWHPEQGALTEAELRATEAEPWFDPAGFLLAVRDEPGGQRLLGFHWTKVHEQHRAPDGSVGPVGEVYVVGVDPDAQGGGLGRALTLAGLRYLAGRGLTAVLLYVEADNDAARAVYRRTGFVDWDADVQYAR